MTCTDERIRCCFDSFVRAKGVTDTISLFETLEMLCCSDSCDDYQAIKDNTSSSYAAARWWVLLDQKRRCEVYRGRPCSNMHIVVIGAGPVGLRTAIEARLLGAHVTVVEKRVCFTRYTQAGSNTAGAGGINNNSTIKY